MSNNWEQDKSGDSKDDDSMLEKNYLLSKNLESLAVFGLWPLQTEDFLNNKPLRRLHHLYGKFVYFLFIIFLTSEYIELYNVWGDLEAMTTNMSVSCLYTVGLYKVYSLYSHRDKFKKLISDISAVELNIARYQNEDIKNILSSYVKRSRRVTYFFWTLTISTLVVFYILPLIEYRFSSNYHFTYENGTEFWSYKRPTIFSSWVPFDKFAFPNFAIVYVYQIFMGLVGGLYHGFWDTFIVSMMMHSIGQLQILQKNMESMTDDDVKNGEESFYVMPNFHLLSEHDDSNSSGMELIKYRRLVFCVHHYSYITRYAQTLNIIISPIMMFYFMVCSLMLCAIGFQASLYGPGLRLALMVEYLIAMMIQLLLFYWHGNEVIYESDKLSLSTYNCEWFTQSYRFRKSFWILREGIRRPIIYTVGWFYSMSLPTFVTILRASYSYFALLRQVQKKEILVDNLIEG